MIRENICSSVSAEFYTQDYSTDKKTNSIDGIPALNRSINIKILEPNNNFIYTVTYTGAVGTKTLLLNSENSFQAFTNTLTENILCSIFIDAGGHGCNLSLSYPIIQPYSGWDSSTYQIAAVTAGPDSFGSFVDNDYKSMSATETYPGDYLYTAITIRAWPYWIDYNNVRHVEPFRTTNEPTQYAWSGSGELSTWAGSRGGGTTLTIKLRWGFSVTPA